MFEDKYETNISLKIKRTEINDESLQFTSKEYDQSEIVELFLCTNCPVTFNDRNDLISHLETHKKRKTNYKKKIEINKAITIKKQNIYQCDYCPAMLINNTIALKHNLLMHPNENNYKCIDCNIVFGTKRLHDFHMTTLHNMNTTNSIPGTIVTNTATATNVPTVPSKEISDDVHKVCNTKIMTAKEYIEDIKQHLKPKINQKVNMKNKLKKEVKDNKEMRLKKNQKIPCEYCISIYPSVKKAIRHKESYHPQYPNYNCRICGKIYPLKFSYDLHMVLQHKYNDEPSINNLDSDSFNGYKCNICQVKFIKNNNLHKHIKDAHSTIIKLNENIDFIPEPSIKVAQGNDDALELNSIYYCHLCGFEYIHKYNLEIHLIRDHRIWECNKKPPKEVIRCDICRARFFSIEGYKTHYTNNTNNDIVCS